VRVEVKVLKDQEVHRELKVAKVQQVLLGLKVQ